MRGLANFVGANFFLFGMLAAGAAVVILLVRLAQLAGADADVMVWLYWPVGMSGIVTAYYAGKHGHRLLSRAL